MLIVQKYGGSSVGTVERINAVAQRVKNTVQEGHTVVVVVSAMGKTTDGLIKLAHEITQTPSRREMDMLMATGEQVSIALLSIALQHLDQPAVSLTGAQVGIVTEAEHSRARILEIKPDRISRHLDQGEVVVVAGFQGVSSIDNLEITTLGRGGSDTSAVALAVGLKADLCEIYTDVPGILTTDPRLVSDAQLMAEITCDEMLELASLGAKVLHPRAVEIARNYGMPLVVRSSWSDHPGTKVSSKPVFDRPLFNLEISNAVDGVEFDRDQAKIALVRVPDRPGIASKLFGEIARHHLDVDLIIQSVHEGNSNDIAFTVAKADLNSAQAVATAIAPVLAGSSPDILEQGEVITDARIAKVSIEGAGMIGRPGIAAKMFNTLAEAGVNIGMITTSEIKVSCLIDESQCDQAILALCQAFEIESSPLQLTTPKADPETTPVRGIALDQNQARLAIRHVVDQTGMAGKIFGTLAEHNISVDMIIQSQRTRLWNGQPTRDIAFTVAKGDAETAKIVLENLANSLGFDEVSVDTEIAKVSIVGAGMIGRPGVAAQLFSALAENNINIQMITTSEIKVSCIVAKEQGEMALKAIHSAFNLGGDTAVEIHERVGAVF